MADLDTLTAVYRKTAMTKRELERHLMKGGISRKVALIVASKCGRDLKPKGFFTRLKEAIM